MEFVLELLTRVCHTMRLEQLWRQDEEGENGGKKWEKDGKQWESMEQAAI